VISGKKLNKYSEKINHIPFKEKNWYLKFKNPWITFSLIRLFYCLTVLLMLYQFHLFVLDTTLRSWERLEKVPKIHFMFIFIVNYACLSKTFVNRIFIYDKCEI